uniref:Uncharacterized protein n=1 Tax=Cucumis melo TaxID=3656 RepID=A0A9I9E708_CUCME
MYTIRKRGSKILLLVSDSTSLIGDLLKLLNLSSDDKVTHNIWRITTTTWKTSFEGPLYPCNNFFHHHVENIILSCLESKKDDIVDHLLRECNLIGKIIQTEKNPIILLGKHGSNLVEEELETHTISAWKEGKAYLNGGWMDNEAKDATRRGNMAGHLPQSLHFHGQVDKSKMCLAMEPYGNWFGHRPDNEVDTRRSYSQVKLDEVQVELADFLGYLFIGELFIRVELF